MKNFKFLFVCLCFSHAAFSSSFLVTLPLVAVDREWAGRAEYNIMKKGGIAFELGGQSAGEDLTQTERTENPGRSLLSMAREVRFMVSRYTYGHNMSGFYWGAGLGYRQAAAKWSQVTQGLSAVEEDAQTYALDLEGHTLNARAGYRMQSDMGVMAGLYLGFEHFEAKVRDSVVGGEYDEIQESSSEIRNKVARKMADRFRPGFEFGWAF
ncbi:MAG: hypothetical protein AB8C84_09290 [Oligoflexales bacterium]